MTDHLAAIRERLDLPTEDIYHPHLSILHHASQLAAERDRLARTVSAYRENVYAAFPGDEASPEVVSESEQHLTDTDRDYIDRTNR